MKPFALLAVVLGGWCFSAAASTLERLNVLYLGEPGSSRANDFEPFLREHVGQLQILPRDAFRPAQAEPFDVVVLDWPQSDRARKEREGRGPLGDRAGWTKPTVLLGSAGLNLAVVWKARGGAG
jgi:hypothetical protein